MTKHLFAILILFCNVKFSLSQSEKYAEEKVAKFVKLNLERSTPDSIVALCNFPFYLLEAKTVLYSSGKAMKKMFVDRDKKPENKATPYKIIRISIDSCRTIPAQLIGKVICVCVKVHLPLIGEGNEGQYLNSIYFVQKKYPFKIVGLKDTY